MRWCKGTICCIMAKKIRSGRVVDDVSISYDLFATISELSGVDDSYSTDGISLVDIFTDENISLDREYIYWEFPSYGGQQAARMGDFKALRTDIKKGNNKIELYNLSEDIREEIDISSENPDIIKKFNDIFSREHVKSNIKRFHMGYIDDN